jgi:hypothetical protein
LIILRDFVTCKCGHEEQIAALTRAELSYLWKLYTRAAVTAAVKKAAEKMPGASLMPDFEKL